MSTEIFKTDMVELFQINRPYYVMGDTQSIAKDIETDTLTHSHYEEMFHFALMNKSYIKDGDFLQMRDLWYRIQKEDLF
jgi:hypothetical protein